MRLGLDIMHSITDRLPVEIILLVARFLSSHEVNQWSQVNKSMRIICEPLIFRSVRVEFSCKSLQRLKTFANSELRRHVQSLTYVVPELLKKGVSLLTVDLSRY